MVERIVEGEVLGRSREGSRTARGAAAGWSIPPPMPEGLLQADARRVAAAYLGNAGIDERPRQPARIDCYA